MEEYQIKAAEILAAIPTSCNGCIHHAQTNQLSFATYCQRDGVVMPCGFGCDKYASKIEPVYKVACISCGHVMRHNDDDLSEPEIVNGDDALICGNCRSTHLRVTCNFCTGELAYSNCVNGAHLHACKKHKHMIGL